MNALKQGAVDHSFEQGVETSDVDVRSVLYAGLGLFVSIAVMAVGVAGLLTWFDSQKPTRPISQVEAVRPQTPAPRLETVPARDRAKVEAQAEQMLRGYAWTDRNAGRVRIPIEKAMRMVGERGWLDATGNPPP